jgi:D-methionine transport system substrate-binding protein
MSISRKLITAAVAAPLIALLAGCATSGSADSTASAGDGSGTGSTTETVKIGVVGASDPYWETYKQAAAAEGIPVDIVDFTDYAQPNPALTEGELDLNQFQHIVYLAQYNVSAGEDLVPIGSTAIYPLGLYSTKYDSVDAIQQGDTVAIPNDESNLARGLLVLQSAGLVTLKDGGSIFSTVDDIDEAASKVKVTTLDAALTATSLPDVAAAIINNDFIEDAGLTADDAIAQDDPSDPNALPYVNIFAARAEDKDNPTFAKLVEIYQNTAAVTDGVKEASGGTAVLLKTPVADLVDSLATVEADTKAHQN